jgi:transcription elongation factor Elf1
MSNDFALTENSVIFSHHDNGFLTRAGTHLRVTRVTGCRPLQHDPMRQVVAEAIDEAERANRNHTERKNARFSQTSGHGSDSDSSGSGRGADADDTSATQALEGMLDGIDDDGTAESDDGSDTRADGGTATTPANSWVVPPNQVKLLELTEESRVRAGVYPRTFRCPGCDHFEVLNPSIDDLSCPDCSHDLRQFPLVFACPRCANVEPMQPSDTTIDEQFFGVFDCKSCDKGHYHLHHGDSLSNAQFECASCGHSKTVRRFCRECHIPSDENGEGGAASVMKPTPTDASSLVSPMVKSALFIDQEHISLEALMATHDSGHDPYRWRASSLPGQEERVVKEFWGLDDLFTVTGVRSFTAVYGYQTRVTAEGTDIDDSDRLVRTFDHGDTMKRAYVTESRGRGLVFNLDTDRLLRTVANATDRQVPDSYEALAATELAALEDHPVKELVDDDHDFRLIPLLHALEHALSEAAAHEIGMDDVLGSKLLIEDGAIVLYESEDVGAGGLAQLTLDQQGQTLKKFLRKAAERLASCGQLCGEGCPSCLYADDHDCRPCLPSEVNRWVPPNALLNRQYAQQFINAN